VSTLELSFHTRIKKEIQKMKVLEEEEESYSQITYPTGITAQTTGSNGYFTKARQTATKHGRYINSL
jgi:hypothetical protein